MRANRISAARLWQLSEALEVPVGYFYDGLSDRAAKEAATEAEGGEMFARKETLDLVRAYYLLGERPRRRLLDLAKSLNGGEPIASLGFEIVNGGVESKGGLNPAP